ncbi:sensor histidine kinase [Streptomyces roseochromogenus]
MVTGFGNQAALALDVAEHRRDTERPVVLNDRDRIARDLDDTIKIIRSTIYALREHDQARRGSGLCAQLVAATERATESLGFAPALRMTGLLDTAVSAEQAEQLLAVLGEALSNAARHAHGTTVDIGVEATNSALKLRAADNGRGIDPAVTATAAWPTCADARRRRVARSACPRTSRGGTVIEWVVPLSSAK